MAAQVNVSVDYMVCRSCDNVALILLLQPLSDKHIATIVEMGFSVQQATSALQHSGGNLEVALNSLLPSDQQNVSTNGQPVSGGRESRTMPSSVVSNGPTHRSDRGDARSQQQQFSADSSYNDRTGMPTSSH